MRVNNKSFKGLDSRVKYRVTKMNKQIGYARAINQTKTVNWQTKHKGYGELLHEKSDIMDGSNKG